MSSNLADLPLDLLADLPPSTDILWSRWVQIWQIYPYMCWQMIYPQYWHLVVKMNSNIWVDLPPLSFLELQKSPLVSFQGCWTQWQRFESSSTHCFWDTPTAFSQNTFLAAESGFLSFLELQKSLLVSFQGCWTQWQRIESSSIHCFWDTPLHFLKTCFNLESGWSFHS